MNHLIFRAAPLLAALFTISAGASQLVVLPDGRQAVLHDDFTWAYVAPADQADSPLPLPPPQMPARVLVEPGADKNLLQLGKGGIEVLLQPARYHRERLIIPVRLANQSGKSVVSVVVRLRLTDTDGRTLTEGEHRLWAAVKRLPDSYLRPGSSQAGKDIELKVPRADHYQLTAEIGSVEYW
ncbi:DUF3157 family protein [Zobellella sp. DQSA1]|uniref:DUF3157 family protein n=1 Tax=Zobellella sp. DQSA1 TaxID=3342386 RepID=UPI0035C02B6E